MKLFKTLFYAIIVILLASILIGMRPTKADFAEYYVSQNQTGLGEFFDTAFEAIVTNSVDEQNFYTFSIFTVNGEDRYIGILGHFFGRSSAEQVANTVENLIEQAKDALDTDAK